MIITSMLQLFSLQIIINN